MGEKNVESKVTLEKNLGLFDCIFLVIGSVIGSGIFISPKGVIKETGSIGLSLIVWLFCGVLSLFGAQSYAELGCMFPKAGGDYEYLLSIFGNLPAFLFIWSLVVIIVPASVTVAALTFADYVYEIIEPGCSIPRTVRILLAAIAIMLLGFINCVSVKWVNRLSTVCSIGKLLGLAVLISFGVYCLIMGRHQNFHAPFENSNTNPGRVAVAFYSGVFSFEGWKCLNNVVEEIKNPNRNLTHGIWISIVIITVFYLFSNVAYFTLLTPREMIASSAVAVTFAEKLIGRYSIIVSVFVALSVFGYLNSCLFHYPRAYFAAARNSHLPSILALININYRTPMISIIFMSATSLICLFFDNIYVLINISVLPLFVANVASVSGLLYLRVKKPDANRPIKAFLFFPIMFLAFSLALIIMTLFQIPYQSFTCLLIQTLGVPFYYLSRASKMSTKFQTRKGSYRN